MPKQNFSKLYAEQQWHIKIILLSFTENIICMILMSSIYCWHMLPKVLNIDIITGALSSLNIETQAYASSLFNKIASVIMTTS